MASKSEHAFIDKVPEEFNCSICTNVLDEPVLTECCGQHFCKNCLENWFEKGPGQKRNKTCPTCRSEDIAFIKSLHLKRKISNLKIYCPNRTKGCSQQLSLGTLDSHLATCSFVNISCSNKCGKALLRKDLQEHCQFICPNRKVKCQYCAVSGIHIEITGSHLTTCPDVPLVCPRRCGEREIKRKDLTAHKQECPQEPVQCPFYKAGCKEKLLRKDLEAHTAFNTQQHLQLVMTTSTRNYAELKAEHRELKAEHQELKTEHQELKAEHQELKVKMEEMVSNVAKEIETCESVSEPQSNTGLQCIKTILLSSTTMLGPGENYYVHFSKLPERTQRTERTQGVFSLFSQKMVYRTPSIYLRPGYKVYLQCHRKGIFGKPISLALTLEKSAKDETLPWPIPNNLEIKVEDVETTDSRQPHRREDATFHSLCKVCNPSVNLSRVDTHTERLILELHQGISRLYAKVTMRNHSCPSS